MNALKLIFLAVVPLTVLIAAGYFAAGEEGSFFAFLFWLVTMWGMYWFGDNIVIKMCRAELLTVYHSPTIFKAVQELCRQAAMPIPSIYMIPEEAPNICSVGRNLKKAGLIFTEGMTNALNHDELRCAIAHELVHIYRRDTPVGVVAAVLAGFLGMSSNAARERASINDPASDGQRLFSRYGFRGVLMIFAPLAAFVIQSLLKINREFRADDFASRFTGKPLDMANAIRIMEKKKYSSPMKVAPAAAHLFLVSPIRSVRIARLFNAHPPMGERIQRLETLHHPANALLSERRNK